LLSETPKEHHAAVRAAAQALLAFEQGLRAEIGA
jgi:hypothetical protein